MVRSSRAQPSPDIVGYTTVRQRKHRLKAANRAPTMYLAALRQVGLLIHGMTDSAVDDERCVDVHVVLTPSYILLCTQNNRAPGLRVRVGSHDSGIKKVLDREEANDED